MSCDGALGARKLRRAEARIGESLLFAVAWGQTIEAVTPDDRHFLWDRRGDTVTLDVAPSGHYTSCPTTQAVLADIERKP